MLLLTSAVQAGFFCSVYDAKRILQDVRDGKDEKKVFWCLVFQAHKFFQDISEGGKVRNGKRSL